MTTIPLRRAVAGEWCHGHARRDGFGFVEHQHAVRSEVHGHPGEGLEFVRLSWAVLRWWRRELVIDVAGGALLVVLVAMLGLALLLASR